MPRRNTRALDDALDERNKLLSNAKKADRAELNAIYEDQIYGDKFRKFIATLNHFGPNDSNRFVDYVGNCCQKWLREAPYGIRLVALKSCDNRIQKIRISMALEAINDPLPGQPDSVFIICKRMIGL